MHTMSFCVKLTHREAKTIRDKLVAYCEVKGLRYYEQKNKWADTKELIFPGFLTYDLNSVKVKAISKNTGMIYYLQIKVNPRMMFHKDVHPFVYIADADDVRNILNRIQDFLDMTDINDISKDYFYIQRIDYCANIRLRSRYEVEEYMRLVRKGLCPYPAKRKEEFEQARTPFRVLDFLS